MFVIKTLYHASQLGGPLTQALSRRLEETLLHSTARTATFWAQTLTRKSSVGSWERRCFLSSGDLALSNA